MKNEGLERYVKKLCITSNQQLMPYPCLATIVAIKIRG